MLGAIALTSILDALYIYIYIYTHTHTHSDITIEITLAPSEVQMS